MSRLPPAEKLPLAVRKNIRDEWETKKPDFESQISELLGETWTIEIDPKAIYPYGDEGSYAKQSTGSMLSSYTEGAIYRLKYFLEKFGDDGKGELNSVAHAHVLTLDIDVDNKVHYNGVAISPSGQLVLLFGPSYLGTNIDDCLEDAKLTKALNEAPRPEGVSLSFVARDAIKKDYDAQIGPVKEKINALLQKDMTLEANFEQIFAKLTAAGKDAGDYWESNIGNFVRLYFNGVANALDYQKFGDDDLLREGFHEGVEAGKIEFRIVDEGVMKASYNECVIEDGVLYLQTVPKNFGTNVDDIVNGLINLL